MCFTFVFTFSNGAEFCLLFFTFQYDFLLFVLLFQIPKKIEVQLFSYAYQCHTWAMMGLWSLIPPKSKKRKKTAVFAFPRVRKNHFERFYLVVGVAFILCTPKVKIRSAQPVLTVSPELKISRRQLKNRRFGKKIVSSSYTRAARYHFDKFDLDLKCTSISISI